MRKRMSAFNLLMTLVAFSVLGFNEPDVSGTQIDAATPVAVEVDFYDGIPNEGLHEGLPFKH